MRGLCDDANVKPFGFHAIRHVTASTLYKLGYEVAAIQSILLHKSPGTTERYLKSIGMERVREALESLAPKVEDAEVMAFEKMLGTDVVGDAK